MLRTSFKAFVLAALLKSVLTETASKNHLPKITGRIINGYIAAPDSHPHLITFLYNVQTYCQGALIDDQFILTVAHCKYLTQMEYDMVGGLYDRFHIPTTAQKRKMVELVAHPIEDLAVIYVDRPFERTPYVHPINLSNDLNYPKGVVTIAGWGYESFPAVAPKVLMETELDLLPLDLCADKYLCYGRPSKQTITCSGDSGSPVIQKNKQNEYELIGIHFGGTCDFTHPSMGTRIKPDIIEWIEKTKTELLGRHGSG